MRNKPTILAVDDHEPNLALIEEIGNLLSCRVITAFDGEAALLKVKDMPDIILLDVMMPKMNGLEVLKRLKEDGRTKDIPVIIISSLRDASEQKMALTLGAQEYMTKPVNIAHLMKTIKYYLASIDKGIGSDTSIIKDCACC